jgi:hypothetical protein
MSEPKPDYTVPGGMLHLTANEFVEYQQKIQYRGSDFVEVKAVFEEFDYSMYRAAQEIIRLRKELERLQDEVGRG